ncbi:hypothetical protein [Aliikangiella coralliicola]|uniref:Uncharacterized protein n=1 Tax=Aliikangiella coralliicola TaxID=2592383 RepID=A0A545U088_9GAMM|nr:hypothetical protein [Aliikangiella coralliicola]TQV82876.1 hypothetical protein FLL46_24205 [Aliikangiella coralliicola]
MIISLKSFAKSVDSGTGLQISKITVHSNSNAIGTDWEGVTGVYPSSYIVWSAETNCSTSIVLVKKDDSQILSMILAAKMAKKAVRFFVFDNINIDGQYCFVRAITVE